MTSRLGFIARVAAVSALSLAGASAMAQTDFTLNLGNSCTNYASPTVAGQTNTGTCGQVNSIDTKVTGWAANTTASATSGFVQHWVENHGSGLGLGVILTTGPGSIETSSGGNHAVDNYQQTEGVLINFGQVVTLKQLTVGWATSDSDLSLFAYTGSATTAAGVMSGTNVGGATGTSGIGSSWSLVGNYANADNPNSSSSTDTPFGVNAGGISSSWWFVSAYNANYGGSCTSTSGGTSTSCTISPADYFKFLAVAGTYGGGGSSSQTPEPASIALVSMGLIGALGMRRRRAVKPA